MKVLHQRRTHKDSKRLQGNISQYFYELWQQRHGQMEEAARELSSAYHAHEPSRRGSVPPSTGHLTSALQLLFLELTALCSQSKGQPLRGDRSCSGHRLQAGDTGLEARGGEMKGTGKAVQPVGLTASPGAGKLPNPSAEMLQYCVHLAQHASGAELPLSHSSLHHSLPASLPY